MARPRKNETLVTVSVRLPQALLGQVDDCAKALEDEAPLLQVTRTDAIRYLIQIGLEQFAKRKKGRARRA
jgi:metal-responsive CopG/Arc/MetJ family transcriptional regulator